MAKNISFKKENIVHMNLFNGLYGLLIGLLIAVFSSAVDGHLIPVKTILFKILFSVFISLSITNSIIVYDRFIKNEDLNFWMSLIAYYGCNLIGMVIGTELSYMIVSLIFHIAYNPADHFLDYRFNGIVVFVAGTAMLLYQFQRLTLQEKLNSKALDLAEARQLRTQAELQTLQSKINPHFLYNSLNAIAGLIHEDPDKAEKMTINLSVFFRYSVNSSQEILTTIKEEMEMLETYLAIEKVRFGERIMFITNVKETLNAYKIPRFLIQPLVENALKHGLNNKTENGVLELSIEKADEKLEITVSDNGAPFPPEIAMGYGLQSTYDKLKLIYADEYQVQLINEPEKMIRITIPFTA